jgi:hypothetical protein
MSAAEAAGRNGTKRKKREADLAPKKKLGFAVQCKKPRYNGPENDAD